MNTVSSIFTSIFGGLLVPIVIVMLGVAFVLSIKYIASRYKKIQPGRVGIFYGRKYKWPDSSIRGYLVVTGGGRVQMPLVENYLEVPTTAFQVSINEPNVPNKDTVKLTVHGVATCKISTEPGDLNKAIDTLIDKLTTEEPRGGENPLEAFVLNILKGHLRSIIGKMNIDELLRKRDEFNKQVMTESAVELKAMGIDLMNLVIQDIIDAEGYIDALGKQAVADAKADADIKISNATSNASKIKAKNEAEVALAEKDRDVLRANYQKEAATAQAEANMAGQIAQAGQERTLRVAQAVRDEAEKTAQIRVQEQEGARRTAELKATTVATAAAAKETTILNAEAAKQQRIIEAQAEAEALRATAEAKKNAVTLEGEGNAASQRAVLLAQAEGRAAEKRQALLAEAEGTQRLAEALAAMTESARLIVILDKLPNLMDHGGEALAKVVNAAFAPIAAGVGSIDSIRIVDMGGNGDGVGKVSGMVTNIVFEALAQLKSRGIDLKDLAKKAGIDINSFNSLLDGISPAAASHAATPATGSEAPAS